ncbi:hypothetical protein [Salinicola corii]|uniref:hypothetical protein n=1 Tax=Salinicola corii TaxID=2606937 RepID=UPI0016594102|nr:hypothetical protein [Salinicola corii]
MTPADASFLIKMTGGNKFIAFGNSIADDVIEDFSSTFGNRDEFPSPDLFTVLQYRAPARYASTLSVARPGVNFIIGRDTHRGRKTTKVHSFLLRFVSGLRQSGDRINENFKFFQCVIEAFRGESSVPA